MPRSPTVCPALLAVSPPSAGKVNEFCEILPFMTKDIRLLCNDIVLTDLVISLINKENEIYINKTLTCVMHYKKNKGMCFKLRKLKESYQNSITVKISKEYFPSLFQHLCINITFMKCKFIAQF